MIKSKPCKGQNKAFGAEACGKDTPVEKRKYGLCQTCYFNWMMENESGKIHYETQFLPKVKQLTGKEKKKKADELRESLKSIARLIQEARVPFQKWIRLRDANRECAACGDTNMKIVHASHIWKAELYAGMIFDERNVHSCCNKCNVFLNGNEVAFREGISRRYGKEYVEQLDKDAIKKRNYKYTREEIAEIKKYYQKKFREDLKSS